MSYCSSLASFLVKVEANWGPRSDTTCLYSPNHLKMCLKKVGLFLQHSQFCHKR